MKIIKEKILTFFKERILAFMVVLGFILYTVLSLLIYGHIYKDKLNLKDDEIENITEELITARNNECKCHFEETDKGFIIDGAYYEYKGDYYDEKGND